MIDKTDNSITVGVNLVGVAVTNGTNAKISTKIYSSGITNQEQQQLQSINTDDLISKLKEEVRSNSFLGSDDKSDLIDQILIFTKALKEPGTTDNATIRKALKIFDATISAIPQTTKIIEIYQTILPIIQKLLKK